LFYKSTTFYILSAILHTLFPSLKLLQSPILIFLLNLEKECIIFNNIIDMIALKLGWELFSADR